jgi:hypothetical protein
MGAAKSSTKWPVPFMMQLWWTQWSMPYTCISSCTKSLAHRFNSSTSLLSLLLMLLLLLVLLVLVLLLVFLLLVLVLVLLLLLLLVLQQLLLTMSWASFFVLNSLELFPEPPEVEAPAAAAAATGGATTPFSAFSSGKGVVRGRFLALSGK